MKITEQSAQVVMQGHYDKVCEGCNKPSEDLDGVVHPPRQARSIHCFPGLRRYDCESKSKQMLLRACMLPVRRLHIRLRIKEGVTLGKVIGMYTISRNTKQPIRESDIISKIPIAYLHGKNCTFLKKAKSSRLNALRPEPIVWPAPKLSTIAESLKYCS